jgi:hypothetical protein
MSQQGRGTDHSGTQPTGRADPPTNNPMATFGRRTSSRRFSRYQRRQAIEVQSDVDLTEQEGSPSPRADVEVPLNFDAEVEVRPISIRMKLGIRAAKGSQGETAASVIMLLGTGLGLACAGALAGHLLRLPNVATFCAAAALFVIPLITYFLMRAHRR